MNGTIIIPTPTFNVNLATPTIIVPTATVEITMPTPTITVPVATVSVNVTATGATGQGLTWRGAWQSGNNYNAYDMTTDLGYCYICISSFTNSTTHPASDGTHFSQVASKGDTGATGAKGDNGANGADGAGGRINIYLWDYTSVGQGTWSFGAKASQYTTFVYWNAGSGLNGDNLNFTVNILAGTYSIAILGTTDQFSPIVQINLAGTQIASDDWYSAGAVYNVIKTHTGINVTATGFQTLQVKVNGKGSGGYQTSLTQIVLWRTA